MEEELNSNKNENLRLKQNLDKFEKDFVELEESNKSLKQ